MFTYLFVISDSHVQDHAISDGHVVEDHAISDGRVQDRADALFKQVNVSKTLKGRSNDGIASACLYIACRQESVPRTFKGLCSLHGA